MVFCTVPGTVPTVDFLCLLKGLSYEIEFENVDEN
jgi:hypothetical protein